MRQIHQIFQRTKLFCGLGLSALILAGCGQNGGTMTSSEDTAASEKEAGEVVVFSSRKQHLIEPLFEEFTRETGIQVQFITDSPQPLLARIKAAQGQSEADVFMAVDAGSLWSAAEQGLLQPLDSEVLKSKIPAELQEENGLWFGLSQRARTIVYSTERVKPESLSTYAQLADESWKGRLCLRTSQKVYNQSLVGMLLERYSEEQVSEIISGWVANLAAPVFSSDSLLIEAIASGQCDVGIVNTYYLGQQLAQNNELPVKVFWADQGNGGVHVNISGAGIVKNAPNKENAVKLLEFLASEVAQQKFAGLNYEYPVVDGVAVDPLIDAWGEFEADKTPINYAGKNQARAIILMDKAGYK